MKNFLIAILTTTLGLLILLTSCKKDKREVLNEEVQAPGPTSGLTLEKSTLSPLEVAIISPQNIGLNDTSYVVKIANKDVHGGRVGSKIYFMVPEIEAGPYEFQINIGGSFLTAKINVTEKLTVDEPNKYYNDIIKEVSTHFTNVETHLQTVPEAIDVSLIKADLQVLKNQLEDAKNKFNALSETEKKFVAEVLAANKSRLDSVKASVQAFDKSIPDYLRSSGPVDRESRIHPKVKSFIKNVDVVAFDIALFTASAILAKTPGLLMPGLVLTSITGVNLILDFIDLYEGQTIMLNEIYKLEEITGVQRRSSQTVDLVFDSGKNSIVNLTGTYRSFNSSDATSSTPLLVELTASMKTFHGLYSKFKGYVSSALKGTPILLNDIKTWHTISQNLPPKYLSIHNVSNSNVKLTSQLTESGITIKAVNSTTTVQNFSFEINYKSDFSIATNVLSAQVSAGTEDNKCDNINITFNASMDAAGSIMISNVQGGIPGYLYSINNGTFQQNPVFNGPYPDGSFIITVKDSNGCIRTELRPLKRSVESVKELLFVEGWSVISATSTISKGAMSYSQTIGSDYYRMKLCYDEKGWYNGRVFQGSGIDINKYSNQGWFVVTLGYTSYIDSYVDYFTCAVTGTYTTPTTNGFITEVDFFTGKIDTFDESTKTLTYVDHYSRQTDYTIVYKLTVLEIDKTSATISIERDPYNGYYDYETGYTETVVIKMQR